MIWSLKWSFWNTEKTITPEGVSCPERLPMILITRSDRQRGPRGAKLLLDSGEEIRAVTRDPGSAAVPACPRGGRRPFSPGDVTPALRSVEAVLLSPCHRPRRRRVPVASGEHGVRRWCPAVGADRAVPSAGEARFADAFRAPRMSSTRSAWTGPSCAAPTSPPTPGLGAADPPGRRRAERLR